ncbi:PTS system sorbose-specific IIA component [Lactobacillus colini]|uniref:PTS system sorbose-specific IIA component n=1 Tax=Lactobacillus colini TaxID=1819254 RepID=A0ABS4MF01_9LACO|nr:PTS sugar transporter subunit IIA [Lactobacillus colini]MBP2058198.1 PTS system sorbose-specific IIA component [Lactobacillus colini]
MKKIILVGHAKTAVAFKEAVQMIFGKVPDFIPLTFESGEGLKDVEDKITSEINGDTAENVLVVTDLFSGTPYNAASILALKGKVNDVVAGMCLPMLLEIATNLETKTIDEIVEMISSNSKQYISILSQIQDKDEGDDF